MKTFSFLFTEEEERQLKEYGNRTGDPLEKALFRALDEFLASGPEPYEDYLNLESRH